jgi:hypothetical protein
VIEVSVPAEAGKSDAPDLVDHRAPEGGVDAGVAVNEFPGSPYGPAKCRGGADCVGDTQFNAPGADADAPTWCVAMENSTGPHLLTGTSQCLPSDAANGPYGLVLCLSGLDCAGYSCVSATCDVAIYAPYDGGPEGPDQVGTTEIQVSYCKGVGMIPAGCL